MNTDLLGGVLLTAVLLLVVGYLIKEIFGPTLSRLVNEHRSLPPAGINDHLIGVVGRVVAAGEGAGEMRVRVGGEGWNARLSSVEDGTLPIGAQVVVKAVAGHVLEVSGIAPSETLETQADSGDEQMS